MSLGLEDVMNMLIDRSIIRLAFSLQKNACGNSIRSSKPNPNATDAPHFADKICRRGTKILELLRLLSINPNGSIKFHFSVSMLLKIALIDEEMLAR